MHHEGNDIEELRRLIIEEGGNPNTKAFHTGEMTARQRAQQEINRRESEIKQRQSVFHRMASEAITGGLQVLAVAFTLLVLLVGTLIGVFLLIVAEIAAVQKGFAAIDADFAFLYAATTVLFFFVVLFIGEVIRRSAANEDRTVFSLRQVLEWLIYFTGISWWNTWKPRYKRREPLLIQVDNAVRWLMYTIVIFGLLGRLADTLAEVKTIEGVKLNWQAAIGHIWQSATLEQMIGYVGSVVMTIALLLATHFIVYFAHLLFTQVTGGINLNLSEGYSSELVIEGEVTKYYRTELLKLKAKNQQRLTPESQINEI